MCILGGEGDSEVSNAQVRPAQSVAGSDTGKNTNPLPQGYNHGYRAMTGAEAGLQPPICKYWLDSICATKSQEV